LERDLIDGKVRVSELPEVWNSRFEELLGIIPPDDKEGVLQDIHWSMGYFGYFPTYFLGSLYGAQIYNKALEQNPKLPEEYKKGEFSKVVKYLKENIHHHGAVYRAEDLIKKVTGEELNPDYFFDYVEKKFYPVYGL
jgi:carboxypeptidase Taq